MKILWKNESSHRINHYDPGYDDGPLEKTWYTDFKRGSRCSHRYSREIEHSDENKGLLEETLTREEEFRLRHCLRLYENRYIIPSLTVV